MVDDSLSALLLIQEVLEEGGFDVATARSGEAALEVFQKVLPDLVVMDIVMPGLDGLEACRRLRATAEGGKVPILFLTGDTRPELQDEAVAAGGDDLIHKHALQMELMIRVRSLLRVGELQRALARERDAVLEAKQQQDHLFRFIIHDLKNPLQVIRYALDLLAEETLPEEVATWVSRVDTNANLMTRMIQDLLDVMQAEQVGLTLQAGVFPLGPSIGAWAGDVLPGMSLKKQKLQIDVAPEILVHADLELLHRCLVNLLGNASKYSPQETTIRLAAKAACDGLLLLVEDEGPGVPPSQREDIFKPFVRLARDQALQRASSGLGLAFCQLVAQVHGGRIWVEDRETKGSRFCLQLPAADLA